jgi:hypothetical protein
VRSRLFGSPAARSAVWLRLCGLKLPPGQKKREASQDTPLEVAFLFRALPAGRLRYIRRLPDALVEFRPLQRTGWRDNLSPRGSDRGYVASAGFFNLLRFHLASSRAAPCFMRLTLLGFRLQGASDSKQLCSFRSRMPSCRYFQTLFSSEEQKRTRSIGFRALFRLEPPEPPCRRTEAQRPQSRHPHGVPPLQSVLSRRMSSG